MRVPKPVRRAVRVLGTVGIFWLIFRSIDTARLWEVLAAAHFGGLGIALTLLLVVRVLTAVRWWIVLRCYEIRVPFGELTRVVFVSSAVGHVLPGGVGADLLRGYHVARYHGNAPEAAGTIVLDRIFGFFSMTLFALTALIPGYRDVVPRGFVPFVIGVNGLFVALFLGPLVIPPSFWTGLARWRERLPRAVPILRRFAAVLTHRSRLMRIAPAMLGLSLLIQGIRCVVYAAVFQALGYMTAPIFYFMFIPLVFLLTMIPVSVGGLGVREGALVLLFQKVGIPGEVSVMTGLLVYLLQLIAFLPGWVLFLLGEKERAARLPEP